MQYKEISKLHYDLISLVEYKPDRLNEWQSPADTEAKKTGDCEDFAIWWLNALKDKGAYMQAVVTSEGMHMICVVEVERKKYGFCGGLQSVKYALDCNKSKPVRLSGYKLMGSPISFESACYIYSSNL